MNSLLKLIGIGGIVVCYVVFMFTQPSDGAILSAVTNAIIILILGKKSKGEK